MSAAPPNPPCSDDLPAALAAEVARHWERLPAPVREALGAHTARLAELPKVWAASPFIARTCVAAPAMLEELVAGGDLGRGYADGEHRARLAALAEAGDEAALAAGLRRARAREAVRIGWRDIAGHADLEATMAELSDFADAAIDTALAWLERDQALQLGTPCDAEGAAQRLVVLAMGKLGAHELNYSSDVDLVFAYPAEGATRGGRRELANQDYFDRLGRRLIRTLAENTPEGYVLRVDMRLRPFGDAGPLTVSVPALLGYCEAHARDWERYAFVKARAAAGDRAAGERLLEQLAPFVYRRYLDFGALEALREMKRLITEEVRRQRLAEDVKRGPGGIREIEFIGQTFQLIRGGHEPALRERRILAVLQRLAELGCLPAQVCMELAAAYRFLRRVENRLQQVEDRQTHRLPADAAERARLAFSMGYADWSSFAAELERHRRTVSAHFDRLLAGGDGRLEARAAVRGLDRVWDQALERPALQRLLAEAGFDDAAAAAEAIARLRAAPRISRLGRNGRTRLARLMPKLLAAVHEAEQPAVTLERVLKLVDAVALRSVYLALLADNPAALAQLVRLCSASPWIAEHITRQPILLDELLDPRVLYTPPGREELERELGRLLARRAPEDLEGRMDALRHFRHAQVLRVAAADVTGSMPVAEVSNHLSAIAEVVIAAALEQADAYLSARHGRPRCHTGGSDREPGFAVVAYGKLGGLELGYASDLDLVFLHDSSGERQTTDGARPIDNSQYFTRLAQRLIHWLQTVTSAGRAYEVDTRLRPSGESGLLVSTTEAFRRYQLERAWTWEHQALVRARAVAGDPQVRETFAGIRSEVLARPREEAALKADIAAMRERMRTELAVRKPDCFDLKQGPGGITDIEFVVQYIVLRWACVHPELTVWTDNLRLLETIAGCRLLDAADCRTLHDAYFAYRAEVHRLALQERPALVADDALRDERAGVLAVWRRVMGSG